MFEECEDEDDEGQYLSTIYCADVGSLYEIPEKALIYCAGAISAEELKKLSQPIISHQEFRSRYIDALRDSPNYFRNKENIEEQIDEMMSVSEDDLCFYL